VRGGAGGVPPAFTVKAGGDGGNGGDEGSGDEGSDDNEGSDEEGSGGEGGGGGRVQPVSMKGKVPTATCRTLNVLRAGLEC